MKQLVHMLAQVLARYGKIPETDLAHVLCKTTQEDGILARFLINQSLEITKPHLPHPSNHHSEPELGEPCTPTQDVESPNMFLDNLRCLRYRCLTKV